MGARGLEPPNLYYTLRGCTDGISKNLGIKYKNMGARGLEPPNLTDVNRAL